MIRFISSEFGVSMNANPLDSWVSGLRITLTSSYTRFSALSQDLMSSFVTQTGKFPRNTVKLIRGLSLTPFWGILRFADAIHESYTIVSQRIPLGKRATLPKPLVWKEKDYGHTRDGGLGNPSRPE